MTSTPDIKTGRKAATKTPKPAPIKPEKPQLARPGPAFLGFAVENKRGVSRGAQVVKSGKTGVDRITTVAHLGFFQTYEKWADADRTVAVVKYREVENLGEFDGPLYEQSLRQAAAMIKSGATRAAPSHCKADGPRSAPVAKWKDLDHVTPVPAPASATDKLSLES